MKCFLFHKFISLVYISSGHSETEVLQAVGTPAIILAPLIHAVLYTSAMGSYLVLLSRSSFQFRGSQDI